MNKKFKFYAAIWAILLVLYNVIVFLVRSISTQFEIAYDGRFWAAWAITLVAFIGNLVCAYVAFRENNLKKIFLRVP